jgi:hypothetical protein
VLATFSPVIRRTPPAVEGNFIIEREMRREADWKSPSGITEITVAGVEAMVFNVDESTALLHAMYPNYPDMRNSRRGPSDLQKLASAVSGENGRDGGQRELPQLINTSLLLN